MIVHCTLTESGEVSERCVTQDLLGDPEVLSCVDQVLGEARFAPPPGGSAKVSFPFVFGLSSQPGC